MADFKLGQCWVSEAEPELGIGFVRAMEGMSVDVEYPSATRVRRYNKRTAPLRRLEFRVGDFVRSKEGDVFEVLRVENREGLYFYYGASGRPLSETALSSDHRVQRPLERFSARQIDPLNAFRLRRQTMLYRDQVLRSPARGLIGPRAMLLPHQVHVAHQISNRGLVRALLADEVGLGKTIEAGWILHRLVVTERARRILLIVPQALINQWFVEMLRRFNLSFWVPESQGETTLSREDLNERERFIFALESLADPDLAEALLQTPWDMVVVDEAHHIDWTPDSTTLEYLVLEGLSQRSLGLLLLTATPEQLGLEGHFGRLRLVDSKRFSSWEKFEKEHDRYLEVVRLADALYSESGSSSKSLPALQKFLKGRVDEQVLKKHEDPKNKRLLALSLVDYYGTGRIYFRNSRRVVQLEHFSFPKRKLRTYRLQKAKGESFSKKKKDSELREDAVLPWLANFLKSIPQEKVLLICATPRSVIRLKERLQNEYAIKAVEFHEEQPLLARDRNAAYFEEPEGARVLLSSEIGGEGRNFQHARHLVLADLPFEPDVLEQRIGRLDRIGQKHDIEIHVPFLEETREELMARWYGEVFGAFEHPANGASQVHDRFYEELEKFLIKPKTAFDAGAKKFSALVDKAKKDYSKTLDQIEKGRDRLIEINSFDPDEGTSLTAEIMRAERVEELQKYLENIFDGMGIHLERLSTDTLFAEPGDSMFSSYFPALPKEGMRMTFSRKKALVRDDLTLMTWDHPMVTETMDSVLSQEFGNVSVAGVNSTSRLKVPAVLVEVYFLLECVADPVWNVDEFFPSAPIRVVLDAKSAEEVTEKFPGAALDKDLVALTVEKTLSVSAFPMTVLRALLDKAGKIADKKAPDIIEEAHKKMRATVDNELLRLKMLQGKNRLVSDREIEWWTKRKESLEAAFSKGRARLDSFLLVFGN